MLNHHFVVFFHKVILQQAAFIRFELFFSLSFRFYSIIFFVYHSIETMLASGPVEFIIFSHGQPFFFAQTTPNGTLISHEFMTIYFSSVFFVIARWSCRYFTFRLAVLLFYPLLCARNLNTTTYYKFNGKMLRRLCTFNFAYFHSVR